MLYLTWVPWSQFVDFELSFLLVCAFCSPLPQDEPLGQRVHSLASVLAHQTTTTKGDHSLEQEKVKLGAIRDKSKHNQTMCTFYVTYCHIKCAHGFVVLCLFWLCNEPASWLTTLLVWYLFRGIVMALRQCTEGFDSLTLETQRGVML